MHLHRLQFLRRTRRLIVRLPTTVSGAGFHCKDRSPGGNIAMTMQFISPPTQENEGYDGGESTESRSDEESKDAAPDTTTVIDLSGNDAEDLNTTQSGTEDYMRLDSGDESEEDDLSDLDQINFSPQDHDEAFTNEVRHFADHFLDSMGGMDKVLAGEILKPPLKDVSHTGWHDLEAPDIVGTKLFVLCCARSAYCFRFEVYCGQKQHIAESGVVDMKSGRATVVSNLRAVFGDKAHSNAMRLVVVDRFYTYIVLAV
ncbi:hypothetical protein PHMEG_00036494 [Phytophthora megakarya]|uniref:PiggyBac transposable element-derived protein domain-containing protein n=1 Tax=Phytophthora megakarya TaxID=4795 RepID=A0A225UN08_9STRA|nr:hypothetical protein PHMEG_00036494 [Phytophthora megakarya]